MSETKTYYVYIMNSLSGTLYTGMTNDLHKRVYQHKNKLAKGFTQQYNVVRLAYFEETTDINTAIAREKEIKSWRRSKKIALIKSMNPLWKDLAEEWFEKEAIEQSSQPTNRNDLLDGSQGFLATKSVARNDIDTELEGVEWFWETAIEQRPRSTDRSTLVDG